MSALDRAAVWVSGAVVVGAVFWAAPLVFGAEPESTERARGAVPVGIPAVVVAPASTRNSPATGTPGSPAATAGIHVDAAWLARVSQATGIPPRALQAYAHADLQLASENAACALGWNTVAAIGAIESNHGRHGGAALADDGYSTPAIRGAALNGDGVAAIRDTDGGRWDGDAAWDRAVGPMQFIPDTWSRWGADGNGDGIADPNQIDDAALATARYLCASSTMTDAAGWRAAVFAYNHLDAYVDDVAAVANDYAARANG